MTKRRQKTVARWSMILSLAMASGAGLIAIPQPAAAADAVERWCYCSGTTCQGQYERWCCTWNGSGHATCGCSFFISNCQ
jgi:hypothetical protein